MARRRFFVDAVRQGRAELRGPDAEHLTQVLRATPGQRFEISDNEAVYLAEIQQLHKDQVVFQVLELVPVQEPPVRITLLLSLVKFDRLEWIIEKATELGVEGIVPVVAQRSATGLQLAAVKRIERWRKIARESSQQARRARLPSIEPPLELRAALAHPADRRYVLERELGAVPLVRAVSQMPPHDGERLCVAVGPEGGWTDAERERFASAGFTSVSIGSQILRTETAALAAIALLAGSWLLSGDAARLQ